MQDGDDWYYEQDGSRVTDKVLKIGNYYYGFDYDGRMYTDTSFSSYDSNGNWGYFRAKADGKLYVNEWYQDGDYWYYYGAGGKSVREQVVKIGTDYYGFNYNGRMYNNTTFSAYDSKGNYGSFRAKDGGKLYVNSWYQEKGDGWSDWYYYGEEGLAPNGFKTIGGKDYYFSNGYMYTNRTVVDGNMLYFIDSNGYVTKSLQLKDGWNGSGDDWYYYQNDALVKNKVIKIGNDYYGFDYEGRMYNDTSFSSYDSNGSWGYFRAKSGGKLYVNSWYKQTYEYGGYEWYYYGAEGKAPQGLTTISGKTYYFSYGRMYANTSVTVDGTVYLIDENGYATGIKEGWNKSGSNYYFMKDGSLVKNQVLMISGNYYGFNSSGRMYDDEEFSIYDNESGDRFYYRAQSGGKLYVNSWYNYTDEDGYVSWYYYGAEGKAPRRQVIKIGSDYYGFDYYGCMYNNTSFSIYDSEAGRDVYYRAKDGGKLYVNSWYQYKGDGWSDWYYYGAEGKAPSGITTVGGKTYYFDYNGLMYTNTTLAEGTTLYIIDGNGYATSKTLKEGWNQYDGKWYYVQDGSVIMDQVIKIGSDYYGFDYNGRMYDNTTFSIYDYEAGRSVYYRAKEGGKLYVNSWYQRGDSWYYYGEAGKAPSGFAEVNGKTYYFDNSGYMRTNCAFNYGGKAYYVNGSGTASEMKEGWSNYGDYWYYVKDGSVITYKVIQIGNDYYGFDSNGHMYDNNSSFSSYDSNGNWGYFRARSGGKLYVNSWYQNGDNWYYYGEGGKAPSGFVTVSGKQYYFDDNGRMRTECAINYDGKAYYINNNGTASEMKEGWNKYDGKYYYVLDGYAVTYRAIKIGSDYYGFDSDGVMLDNSSDYMRNDEVGSYGYHRAKAGGKLYVEQWVSVDGNWYYYGKGGLAARGLTTVDGQNYYFEYDGRMLTSRAINYDGKAYYFNASGIGTKYTTDGWIELEGYWYYISDGQFLVEKTIKIGSDYYAFNYYGRMLDDDEQTDCYDSNTGEWYYYRAKPGGKLYVNSWYTTNYGDKYYYGAGGKALRGFATVDGKQYYFDYSGCVVTDRVVTQDNKSYYLDDNGSATQLNANGWTQVNGFWFYCTNGIACSGCAVKIGSDYYGFDWEGKMITNPNSYYEFYDPKTEKYYYYRAKTSGKLYVNEWYESYDSWYYYGDEGKALSGINTVGGKKYFFSEQGRMMIDSVAVDNSDVYIIDSNGVMTKQTADGLYSKGGNIAYVSGGKALKKAWKQVGGKWYYFRENGYAATYHSYIDEAYYFFDENGAMYTSCWIYEYEETYYALSSGKLATGEQKIDGKYYYFEDYGAVKTGVVRYKGNTYLCGLDGAYIGTVKGDGWNKINGAWYYVSGGKAATGLKQIDGKYYYFFEAGNMVVGRVYNDQLFDQNGVRVESGWYKLNGFWYYVESDSHNVAYGETTISGKKYYFNPAMYIGERVIRNGNTTTVYTYNSSGVLTSTKTVADGWTLANGVYYFYKDGKPFTGWTGDYYIDNGRMVTSTIIDGYCLGKDGKYIKSGWYNSVYAKSGGKLAKDEFVKIGSANYHFTGYYVDQDIVKLIDGKIYYFDENGKQVGSAVTPSKGWNKVGGKWCYYTGSAVVSGALRIGSDYYYFYRGWMDTNDYWYVDSVNGHMYFGSDGKAVTKAGWYKDSYGEYYYIQEDGTLAQGYTVIDGKTYYFGLGMATGYGRYENRLAHFSSSGALDSFNITEDGWIKWGNNYYYRANGRFVDGAYTIDGKTYLFSSGRLVKLNVVGCDDGKIYFADKNGVLDTKVGWKTSEYGYKYYVCSEGYVYTGIRIINGTTYYFNGSGRLMD